MLANTRCPRFRGVQHKVNALSVSRLSKTMTAIAAASAATPCLD